MKFIANLAQGHCSQINPQQRRVIGGIFELDQLYLGNSEALKYITKGLRGTWTASGRSALWLLLKELQKIGVNHAHLPAYLCESILSPVQELGMEYSFYPVDLNLIAYPDPPPGSVVIIIHYFGWINPATEALRKETGKSFYLIEDATQALLSNWLPSTDISRGIIVSPRKFAATPLGGWCNLDINLYEPIDRELEVLTWRSISARLTRKIYLSESHSTRKTTVENFYLETFKEVESFFDAHPTVTTMPQIVLDIIAGLNWDYIAKKRRSNWWSMNKLLLKSNINVINPVLTDYVVPLGYTIKLPSRDKIRGLLAKNRIFCPVYWPLPHQVNVKHFPDAKILSETLLTLVIDQRYNREDMKIIANNLLYLLKTN